MKKIILSILILSPMSLLMAQTSVNIPTSAATSVSSTGVKTYQYSDSSGNSQTVTSPVPGVYIRQPQWMQDITNMAKDANATKAAAANSANTNNANNAAASIATNPNNLPSSDTNTTVNTITPNQLVNGALPATSGTENTTKVTQQHRIGQVKDTSVNTYSNQISDWNQTTLQEFEESGKAKLQKSYSEFLMQR